MAATQSNTSGSDTQLSVNDIQRSATFQHILGYPVVDRFVHTLDGNKTIHQVSSTIHMMLNNVFVLFAWLQGPYQYVRPYVEHADEIGDRTLTRMDERFPAVKKPADELYTDLHHAITQNVLAQHYVELKHHVDGLYREQYKKVGGDGLPTMAKSAVNTTLIVTSEALTRLQEYMADRKQAGEGIIDGAAEKTQQKMDDARTTAGEVKDESREAANDSIDGNWD